MEAQIPGTETINYTKEKDVAAKLLDMTGDGPDVGIEVRACPLKQLVPSVLLWKRKVLLLEGTVKDCSHYTI